MKRLTFIFLFSLIAVSLFAQSKKEYRQKHKLLEKYFFATTTSPAAFNQSVAFDNNFGAIIIPVVIKGKTYHFVFDTGAMSGISDSLNKELQLPQVFEGFIVHDASGNEGKQPVYNIPDLQIGDVHFANTGCIVFNFDALSKVACTKIDGIIGASMMRCCYWKADFQTAMLTFSNKLPQVPADAVTLAFHEDFSGSPQLRTVYGGYNFDAGWDTGNNGLFDLPDSLFFKSYKRKNTPFITGSGRGVQSIFKSERSAKYRLVADSLNISDHLFSNEVVEVTAIKYPIIGTAFMKNHNYFILDFNAGKIYLQPQSQYKYDDYTRSIGFSASLYGDTLKADFIWENSSAEKAGLKFGDIITSINGQSTVSISQEQWCNLRDIITTAKKITITTKGAAGADNTLHLSKTDLLKNANSTN